MDWLATLDFRTCPTCYANEVGSPYREGELPEANPHPNCRCVIIPHEPDEEVLRPFVKDARSVKDIPKGERPGKIGQTTGGIEGFFARMRADERAQYLGPSRAKLWDEGKITDYRQLINQRNGRPLTLDQLPS